MKTTTSSPAYFPASFRLLVRVLQSLRLCAVQDPDHEQAYFYHNLLPIYVVPAL